MPAIGLLKNCELDETYDRVTTLAEAKFRTVSLATFHNNKQALSCIFSMFLQLPIHRKTASLSCKIIIDAGNRAGLNEREASGKVLTARPPKRLAQLWSVSHALVSSLQNHRSKMSKLIPFGSLHFRDNGGWPCTAVRMWLTCSNRKLYHKKTNRQTSIQVTAAAFFRVCPCLALTAGLSHSDLLFLVDPDVRFNYEKSR